MHKIIKRDITSKVLSASRKMPVLFITGPRQSGKTTLVRSIFKNHKYVSLENPDTRDFAISDPRGFLKTHGSRVIIDEAQHVPALFSYIQTEVDEKKTKCSYILTGSQNFMLHSKISQSLAGRVKIFSLLPFSYNELKNTFHGNKTLPEYIFKGFYPRLYDTKMAPEDWYKSYIQTYIERDVRQILNVGDLNSFRVFLKVCAGRSGQVLNLSSIAGDIGVSYQTVKKWLSVLEQSYIVHLLQPYHVNLNKRLLKSPKLYFYDTGLLCSLLMLNSAEDYEMHYMKGSIFETFIISELLKNNLNRGLNYGFYFLRDSNGYEIDCIAESSSSVRAIEIKAGSTIKSEFLNNLLKWNKLNPKINTLMSLIYGGDEDQIRHNIKILNWRNIPKLMTPA